MNKRPHGNKKKQGKKDAEEDEDEDEDILLTEEEEEEKEREEDEVLDIDGDGGFKFSRLFCWILIILMKQGREYPFLFADNTYSGIACYSKRFNRPLSPW